MKIRGKTVDPPKPIRVPLARKEIELYAGAIMSFDEFERLCPEPEPPVEMDIKTKKKTPLRDDERYTQRMEEWVEMKTCFMVITALQATEGLEWETVNPEDPDTWKEWRKELQTSFSAAEIDMIVSTVYQASMPTEDSAVEALGRFTSPQEDQPADSESHEEEQVSTPSGDAVNA